METNTVIVEGIVETVDSERKRNSMGTIITVEIKVIGQLIVSIITGILLKGQDGGRKQPAISKQMLSDLIELQKLYY